MLLQRVWGVRRLKNVRRLGMWGGTLASCALALATVVPSAYALACGSQHDHKTIQTSSSRHMHNTAQNSGGYLHATSTVHDVYVNTCSCEKDRHLSSATHHGSDSHGSSSDAKGTGSHHRSTGGDTNTGTASSGGTHGGSSQLVSNGGSGQPVSSGGGSSTTPGLPFTGSDPA